MQLQQLLFVILSLLLLVWTEVTVCTKAVVDPPATYTCRGRGAASQMIYLALLLLLLIFSAPSEATICPPGHGPTYTCADTGDAAQNGHNLADTIHYLNIHCGDTIILPHGATFTGQSGDGANGEGNFTGAAGCTSTNPVIIKSDALGSIAARATYADIPNMVTLNNSVTSKPTVIYFDNQSGWVWQGILFTTTNQSGTGFVNAIVANSVSDTVATNPSDLIYDRVVIRPYEESLSNPDSVNIRSAGFGIRLDGVRNTIKNSTIDGFCCKQSNDGTTTTQSEGIAIVGGAGPYTITNNYIGAYGWNIFTGGGGDGSPSLGATMTSATYTSGTFSNTTGLSIGDVIRLNYASPWLGGCRTPTTNPAEYQTDNLWAGAFVSNISGSVVTWVFFGPAGGIPPGGTLAASASWNPTGDMVGFTVTRNSLNKRAAWASNSGQCKSFWEIKEASSVLFEGNILTGPADAAMTAGFGVPTYCPINIALATNQSGSNPWVKSNNNVFQNNLMYGVGTINPKQPYGPYCAALGGSTLAFTNNLLFGGQKDAFIYNANGSTWTFSHNTVTPISTRIVRSDPSPGGVAGANVTVYTSNLTLRDTILSGVSGYFAPLVNFTTDFPGLATNHNIIIDAAGCTGNGSVTCNGWTKDTTDHLFTSGSNTDIGYVNLTDCLAVTGFGAGGDYHSCGLASGSMGHNAASDGTDIGVNFTQLDAALNGTTGTQMTGATVKGATIK